VAIAACFAQNTKALILDEPTSHLDVGHQVSLLNTLVERSQTRQQTVIASLHEISLISRGFTHALLLIEDGSYIAGSVAEVVNPVNLQKSLGHPITEATTTSGQTIYIPA
jgi:iron complex transport system ATP-binding protein